MGRLVTAVFLVCLLGFCRLASCQPVRTAKATPLHQAAIDEDAIRLKQLLDSGKYDVNALDEDARTPLAAAMATCDNFTGDFKGTVPGGALIYCEPGLKDTVAALLICAGADVNVDVFPKERPGYKLIHIAACHGAEGRDLLLGAGADPNARYTIPETKTTVSPLTWAITCSHNITNNTKYGFPHLGIETLLDAGADPLLFGKDKPASALFNMPEDLKRCNKPGSCKAAEVQRKLDALYDQYKSSSSWSEDTAYWEKVWVAQEGMYIDSSGKWQKKPANYIPFGAPWFKQGKQYACDWAQEGIKLEQQARADQAAEEDYKQRYPLHVAVAANDLATVKKLLDSGKHDVNEKDNQGLTALQVAMTCDMKHSGWTCPPRIENEMAKYLISKGAKVKGLMAPVGGAKDTNGTYTLLHEAAFRGLTTLVKLFIKAGADVNAVYYSPSLQQNLTPLMSAARCDFRLSTGDQPGPESTNSTIKALLEAGANPLPFGPSKPTTAIMDGASFGGDKLDKECSEKVGVCKEAEVKPLVDKWKAASHSGSCPDSFFDIWKAQEKAAADKSGSSKVAASGRKLLGM